MAEIPTGSVFGPTLAGAMSGGSDPFRNALQAMGAVPQALVLAQSLSTRGQKEYDRRQEVKIGRADIAAGIAKNLGFGGSDLDAIFSEFATSDTPTKGTRGGGVSAGAADTSSGAANVGDLRRLAERMHQRSRVEYRDWRGERAEWPQSKEDIAAGLKPSLYKSISRLQEKDRRLSPQYREADENLEKLGSLRAALDELTSGRLGKIERIERLQEIAETKKGKLSEGEFAEREELKKEVEGLTDQIGERSAELEKAIRFKPDMGLENPATRIGLSADYILDPDMLAGIGSLLKNDHPSAREALNVIGVDPSVTAEDLKGMGSEVETYRMRLSQAYRKDLTAKRKQQTELDLAGRKMLMKGALFSRGYSGGNDDLIAQELAKLDDADAQAFIDDLGRKADLDSRIKEAGINANKVTRVINEYRGLHQKRTGTGIDPATGEPTQLPPDAQAMEDALDKLEDKAEHLRGLEKGPDGRRMTSDEYKELVLTERRIENKQAEWYAATRQSDVRFPSAMNAAQYAWDKNMNMVEADQFMKNQGFGAEAPASLEAFGRHGAWNKHAAEKPAAAKTGAAAPKSFKEWRSMRSAAQNNGWDDSLRAVALQAKRDGVNEAVYMNRAKEAVKAPDAMWGLPGALAHVENIYKNTKQSDPFEASELGRGTYDPAAGPSDEEMLAAGGVDATFNKLKAEWRAADNKSEVESRLRPWLNSLGRKDYEKYEDKWQEFLRENAR